MMQIKRVPFLLMKIGDKMSKFKKFLSVSLCLLIFTTAFMGITVSAAVKYPVSAVVASANGAQIWSLPGTTGHEIAENKGQSTKLCTLENGTALMALGEEKDGDGDTWYKVKYGENYENEGYAFSTRVKLNIEYEYDEDFEKNLENFPESYRDSLRTLHAKYPNWKFVAHDVGLSFTSAVEAQYGVSDIKDTRKWVEFTYGGNEWRDMRGYDAATDSWATLESRWTYASRAAIEYFMDPRNSLDENKIFVFAQQSYNANMQNKEGLRSVVKGTFLENGYDGNADAYIDDIMAAAQESGVSPYILAATIIVEQGTSGNTNMVSGTYGGFEGYYNFFNYSASGNTTDEITVAALTYAKNNGWNSRTASIVGGAKKYADGYINIGQDTYYYKDFNVVNKVWWHQYASALYDAWTNASYLKKGCTANTDAAIIFTIPVYSNMPNTACGLPVLPSDEDDTFDINGDNKTNNKDLGLLMQYLNGWEVEIDTAIADINGDGRVNNKDYGLLMQYINGWEI